MPARESETSQTSPERNTNVAQKTQVLLIDDLDGGPGDETVSFSLDGVGYEIDLSAENAAKMRDALAVYVGSARKQSSRPGGTRRARGPAASTASGAGGRTAPIRQWARDNGYTVSARGRVPGHIVDAYNAAQR
jgi:hypothetical protein